jgi:subtilisin family serine protease
MEWNEVAQAVLLVFVAVALALFALERRDDRFQQRPEERTISGVFSNPYLRIIAILLMVLVVFRGFESGGIATVAGVTVLVVGTTVAGADFILMLVALLKGNATFITEHFKFERERLTAESQLVSSTPLALPTESRTTPELGAAAGPAISSPAPADGEKPAGADQDALHVDPLALIRRQHAMASIGLPPDLPEGRADVRVAVLSTGIGRDLARHAALIDRLEIDVPDEPVAPVAAAAVGCVAALAPRARIRLFNSSGDGWLRRNLDGSFRWGANVVMLDFGLIGPKAPADVEDTLASRAKSMVFVAPAGSHGKAEPVWPAKSRHATGVAALDVDGRLADFSSYEGISVAAPGVRVSVLSGVDMEGNLTFSEMSGTNVAAGIVTAVTALLMSRDPTTNPASVETMLVRTGQPVPDAPGLSQIRVDSLLDETEGRRAAHQAHIERNAGW